MMITAERPISTQLPELQLYKKMYLLRAFEEKVQELYRGGSLPGFVHLYIGEEAVAVGVCANLRKDDYITSTHRGHGHALAKGTEPRKVMAELWGKKTGCSFGRGGSMHLFEPEVGLLGTNGLVAAGIPIATGAALTAQLNGKGQVAVAFFGDGAVNHGAFHEALNLAAVWQLPVIFVCENNLYATETAFSKATRNQDVSSRAAYYGMPGYQLDGNDVLSIAQICGKAIEQARQGGGPSLVECLTYRFVGHHEGDPGTGYRTKTEVEHWKSLDPLIKLKTVLIEEQGGLVDGQFVRMEEEINQIIKDAVEFARSSPFPDPQEALLEVF